jgi:hypothetical protein
MTSGQAAAATGHLATRHALPVSKVIPVIRNYERFGIERHCRGDQARLSRRLVLRNVTRFDPMR